MPVSDAIRCAVEAVFAADHRAIVLDGLATIPEASTDSLQQRPPAEFLQAAVVALSFGDLAIFEGQLVNARVEPRDVLYVLESPGEVQPGLTRGEFRQRYRDLNLSVPDVLASDA
ncbi:hypothetical protein [Paludisphaera rhizosphaerae]|uniref:hypothetical protein n=1 Tax=Paludisphaera rhizosphaerae TaxID=2711216 RepID=UPI0013E9BC4B|nr:hypothetical protein [Paludisphaera rhizosphaerae]